MSLLTVFLFVQSGMIGSKVSVYISTYSHGYQLLNFMQGMGKLLSDIPYLFPQELKANFEVFLNVNIFSTSNPNSLLTRKKITP